MTKPRSYSYNMDCMNPHCFLFRSEGHFFCTPCYKQLPQEIRRQLWDNSYSVISQGIQEAKLFFRRQHELANPQEET
jgi:hypothetical protein